MRFRVYRVKGFADVLGLGRTEMDVGTTRGLTQKKWHEEGSRLSDEVERLRKALAGRVLVIFSESLNRIRVLGLRGFRGFYPKKK